MGTVITTEDGTLISTAGPEVSFSHTKPTAYRLRRDHDTVVLQGQVKRVGFDAGGWITSEVSEWIDIPTIDRRWETDL